jgi:phage shock protein E
MNIFERLFGKADTIDLQSIIDEGAFLVDVRTAGEYALGHVKGSVNIPLNMIQSQLPKFKDKKNIVVFCQSGGRSRMAKSLLEQCGFTNVINGGTWNNINELVS